jgi:Plasmid pRiA4b ORF-3-like protein
MDAATAPDAYLVYVWIRDIHPLLWRRVLVRTDRTLAALHWPLQIVFGWTDFHLHRFRIRKTDYGIPRHGLMEGHDARQVRLADLALRLNERFLYEYDFGDLWQVEVRIEQHVPIAPRQTVPVCIGGRWGGPPEDCGGPEAFLEQRDAAPWRTQELLDAVAEAVAAEDLDGLADRLEDLRTRREWLAVYHFDRRAVNRRLRQYAQGDDTWRRAEGEGEPCD